MSGMRIWRGLTVMWLLPLAACTGLPRSGPVVRDIEVQAAAYHPEAQSREKLPFALVDLTAPVIAAVRRGREETIASTFGSNGKRAPDIRLAIGDVVQVTIFESQAGGLFVQAMAAGSDGNYVTLPQQTVDQSGLIAIPYAGSIRVAGRNVGEVQIDIEGRLAAKAIEPQAVISLIARKGAQVSVLGDVGAAGSFPLDAGGNRILDMLSKASGIRSPGYEVLVTLQRGGKTAEVAFEELVSDPSQNIYVLPGDVIYAARQPRSFLAYGASGESGKFDFSGAEISLAEAIGQAKGLADSRADPRQVFVYRIESRTKLARARIDLSAFPSASDVLPVIYRANLRDPAGFFLAQGFPMEDKDIVYVSNASTVELAKFLSLLQVASSIGADTSIPARW